MGRGAFARGVATVAVAALVATGCGGDGDGGKNADADRDPPTSSDDAPAGPGRSEGAAACARVTGALITAAIGDPYRDIDVRVLQDFPLEKVVGFECKWEHGDEATGRRMLQVDLLDFARTPVGTLDESWQGAVDIAGDLAERIDGLGDEAIGGSLPGVSSVSARQGTWQVTALSTSDGSIPAADVGTLALVVRAGLEIAG